jgi:hypothetical protein
MDKGLFFIVLLENFTLIFILLRNKDYKDLSRLFDKPLLEYGCYYGE